MTAPARPAATAAPAASAAAASAADPSAKKPVNTKAAWRDARALMWQHRRALSIGFALMLVSRVSGLLLPASGKWLIDEVIGKKRFDLIWPLALAAAGATAVQAVSGFALSQVISVAAQRAISDMRRRVQARVTRLPVRYFDDHQTGVLISRIMNDAEGIRNLVGTGIVQLVGGAFTAVLALGVLLWLNWQMTAAIIVLLALFGWGLAVAFKRLRPIFRERGRSRPTSRGGSTRRSAASAWSRRTAPSAASRWCSPRA
jgi:subfamily B ATP-binding cassette protein MsbA